MIITVFINTEELKNNLHTYGHIQRAGLHNKLATERTLILIQGLSHVLRLKILHNII